jgi:hypothetical protein
MVASSSTCRVVLGESGMQLFHNVLHDRFEQLGVVKVPRRIKPERNLVIGQRITFLPEHRASSLLSEMELDCEFIMKSSHGEAKHPQPHS